jgi:hypothetical protein
MIRGICITVSGLVITVLVCLITINAVMGHATRQNMMGFGGHIDLTEEILVSVYYDPNPKDPSRLGAVNLEISTISGEKSINQVLISTDNGNNWVSCTKASNRLWTCAGFSGEGEIIRNIHKLEIVIN